MYTLTVICTHAVPVVAVVSVVVILLLLLLIIILFYSTLYFLTVKVVTVLCLAYRVQKMQTWRKEWDYQGMDTYIQNTLS